MKVINIVTKVDGTVDKRVIEICPLCGKEMNETELGHDYCDGCTAKLKEDN